MSALWYAIGGLEWSEERGRKIIIHNDSYKGKIGHTKFVT